MQRVLLLSVACALQELTWRSPGTLV